MQHFTLPLWVWLNAGVLVIAATYVGIRLVAGSREPAESRLPGASTNLDALSGINKV
jgi:hypothetical protein